MFAHKEHLLKDLLDEKRHVPPDSARYFDIVAEYNEILNSMIDSGLSGPLRDDLLIDPHLLSDKYFDFERRCEQGYTIDRFIKEQCSFVFLAEIGRVRTSSARAKVVEQYLGVLPRFVEVGFFIPWGFSTWLKKGEQALIFLDQSLTSLGLLGRMPVFRKDGREYAASYSGHRDFWPYEIDVREDVVDGESVYSIDLETVKGLLSNICRETDSLRGTKKSLALFKKIGRPASITLVNYVGDLFEDAGEDSAFYVDEEEI
jgi:hypothetical protein